MDTQLKGLVELERRCQDLMQEVELLNARQEVLAGMVMSERDVQKEAPKKYQEKVFGGIQGVRGAKGARSLGARAKEAYAYQVGRRKRKNNNFAKMGGSRAIRHWSGGRRRSI